MIVYLFAAIIGAVISAALFWPFGPVIALAVAPFGGSLFAAYMAVFLVLRTLHRAHTHASRRAEPSRTPALRQPKPGSDAPTYHY